MSDEAYWCRYGRWHVVPDLAARCRVHDPEVEDGAESLRHTRLPETG